MLSPPKAATSLIYLENSVNSKQIPAKTPKKTLQNSAEELNSWSYCNPDNFGDILPQPFRLISHILEETLLSRVFSAVFLIEKHKSDANYEGNIKEIASSGSFELEGVSFLAKIRGNPHNQLLAGDFCGNVFLLDMNKKLQNSKFCVCAGKRVANIAANTVKSEDFLTTVAVICRGDANVHGFRYKAGENRVFKSFCVNLCRNRDEKTDKIDKNSEISRFPYCCSLSEDSRFLAVWLYNGNIQVFRVPEPQYVTVSAVNNSKTAIKPLEFQEKKPAIAAINLETATFCEVFESFYTVSQRFPLKSRTYAETLKEFLDNCEKKNAVSAVSEETDAKTRKLPAKAAVSAKIDPLSSNNCEFETNEARYLGEFLRNDKDADISEEIALPKYRSDAYFLEETLVLPHESKTFSKLQEFRVVSGLIVANLGQKLVELHKLQEVCQENLAIFLQNKLKTATNLGLSSKKTQENSLAIAKTREFFEVLYRIECSAVNKSCSFLALGLEDGSVLIFDLLLREEHGYLDKHKAAVTNIRFFEEWSVVSGSSDGSVHLYNIKEKALVMKRSNIFKPEPGLQIKALEISEAGVALVIDNRGNARVYDVVHGEKIMRLLPVAIMEESKKTWKLQPSAVLCAQKGELFL